jgi:phosphatidylcholine synthase
MSYRVLDPVTSDIAAIPSGPMMRYSSGDQWQRLGGMHDHDLAAKGGSGASGSAKALAFAVHVFTAFGAALALLALIAAVRGDWVAMFIWLALALFVDGVDGMIARHLKVSEVLPRWSGDGLDFVVDFVTYVFVPAYAIVAGGLLPEPLAIPLGLSIVVSGALYFADTKMKMPGNYFRGFPALWNAAAFYLFVVKLPVWWAATCVLALVVLTFVPIRFIHPVRVARFRKLNLGLLALWGVLGLVTLLSNLNPDLWVTVALCAIAVYFFTVGFAARTE